MACVCFKCNAEQLIKPGERVARSESCTACSSDLRTCRNCRHFDAVAYNQCREPQADRVVEKERANFCDYFSFRDGEASSGSSPLDVLKKLDDLFK